MKKAELWIAAAGYPLQQKIYAATTEYTFTYSNVAEHESPRQRPKLELPKGVSVCRQ